MLTRFNDDPDLLKKVISADESWVYGYDFETKDQSIQWKRREERRPKKARQVGQMCRFYILFSCCNGVVHHEFLPQRRMVNKEYYLEVKSRLRKAIHQKCTKFWKNQSWILHHNNASAHTSMIVPEFLAKNKTVIMLQPPAFTGLGPC